MNRPTLKSIAATVVAGVLSLGSASPLSAANARSVPDFSLLDLFGKDHELYRAKGRAVVLFFTGVGCPIARKSAEKLQELASQFGSEGVSFWIVDSYPEDSTKDIQKEMMELGLIRFTVLKDSRQTVALAFGVERTAEVVVISLPDHKRIYQGAIDDQLTEGAERPEPQNRYLAAALKSHLAGQPVETATTKARGCRLSFAASAETAQAPDYSTDVAPILRTQCAGCHRDGGIGPWAMDSHGRVKNYARMIEEVILTRRMPPFDPNPDFGVFKNGHRLSREESQTLMRWIDAGAPRGDGPDPLTEPLPPLVDWSLGKPDLVLRLPEVQQIPATGVLEYRKIPMPTPTTNEFWLAGVDIRPGNRKVVHHVILYAQWPGCPDDGSGNGVFIYGWAPGAQGSLYPDGVGKRVPAGATFMAEVHYTTCGSPQTDQSEIALYLRSGPQDRAAETRQVSDHKIDVAPGDPDARRHAVYAFRNPATIYSLSPHMHFRGKAMKYELLLPSGKRETLLDVPRYDFRWQHTYLLKEPRKVPAGSWLLMSGAFDNSADNPNNPDPKKEVTFGLQSWDEMFMGFFDAADEPTVTASNRASATGGQP